MLRIILEILVGAFLIQTGYVIAKRLYKAKQQSTDGKNWFEIVFQNNKDFDTTIHMLLSMLSNYFLFFMVVIGLFVLEFCIRFVYLNEDGTPKFEPVLTEALIHTIVGFIAGWISNDKKNMMPKMTTENGRQT